MNVSRVTPPRVAYIAALVALLVALPTVRNGFVEDDHWVVERRPLLQHPPSILAVLAEPYWPRTFGGGVWRPAPLASFALDYRFTSSPLWFHAVNVMWLALATAVLTLLAARLAGAGIGLTAGLLFAVHPVHVEAVATVVGRAELMAATGYGCALLCALLSMRPGGGRWLGAAALSATLAIASKESAVTLPAAVLLVGAAHSALSGDPTRSGWRRGLRAALPAAAVTMLPVVLYFVLRSAVTGGILTSGGVAPGLRGLNAAQRAWVMLPLTLEWWRLLLFPARLSADYSPAQVSVGLGRTWAHLAALGAWVAVAAVAWRLRERAPGIVLAIAWIALTLVTVANVLVPTEILVAERTLFLASWGACVALATLVAHIPWAARARAALVGGVVVLGAARSVTRVEVWRDDEHWFAALRHDAPRSYRTLWLEGNAAFGAGQWGSGERLLHDAIAAAPDLPGAREDLAAFYGAGKLWRPAADLLRQSLALDSSRVRPWLMLPRAALESGDTAAADLAAREALRRFPTDSDVERESRAVLARRRR